MWVRVAVWQLCELLYTCYLLTYFQRQRRDSANCPPVCIHYSRYRAFHEPLTYQYVPSTQRASAADRKITHENDQTFDRRSAAAAAAAIVQLRRQRGHYRRPVVDAIALAVKKCPSNVTKSYIAAHFCRLSGLPSNHGFLGPLESAPKPAHDRLIRFRTAYPCAQHTHRHKQTTKRQTLCSNRQHLCDACGAA